MKELINQLSVTKLSMLLAADALLVAGHPDKCKEMAGAASVLGGWIYHIAREKEKNEQETIQGSGTVPEVDQK